MVLIWGSDAEKLMEFVYKNRKAYVWIELKEPPAWVSTSGLPQPCIFSPLTLSTTTASTLEPSSPPSAPSHASLGVSPHL